MYHSKSILKIKENKEKRKKEEEERGEEGRRRDTHLPICYNELLVKVRCSALKFVHLDCAT